MKPGPKTNRPFILGLRLTYIELETLTKWAEDFGIGRSEFIRTIVFNSRYRRSPSVAMQLRQLAKKLEDNSNED